MPRDYSVQPPKIPGLVYNGRRNKIQILFIAITVLIALAYSSRSLSAHDLIIDAVLLISALVFIYLTYRKNPNSVYMDQYSVRADFGSGIVVQESLDNYFLAIGQALKSSPMTKNY